MWSPRRNPITLISHSYSSAYHFFILSLQTQIYLILIPLIPSETYRLFHLWYHSIQRCACIPLPGTNCRTKVWYKSRKERKKKRPGLGCFIFGEPAATYHVGGEPRSNSSGLLRASQPGAAASVRPSRPENDTLYVFCCAPASRTLRVLPAQGPKEEYQTAKEREHHVVFSFFWDPAATYLSGPSPAKYCRRIRA